MIDFDEALAIVLAQAGTLGTRARSISRATVGILAEYVKAAHPLPPLTSSSMDGFALRSADTAGAHAGKPVILPVAETVYAGGPPSHPLKRGEACRIMTGAQIAQGADSVVMKERVSEVEEGIAITHVIPPGNNVRRKGEEYRTGAIVLRKGVLITPPVAGLIATAGHKHIRVYRRPRIGLIITGNEVRPPGAALKAGQIHDANSTALLSALRMIGMETVTVARAADQASAMRESIQAALRSSDVVITVGGISVGDRDFVREAMSACGVQERFWRIAMKPGKPNYFGTKGKRMVFGLPGNPVSALLSFHFLVRPALARMSGRDLPPPLVVQARLEADLSKRPGRLEFVRMRLSHDGKHDTAAPVSLQESHMLSGVAEANAIYRFPKDASSMRRGRRVPVEILDWGWS